MKRSLIRQVFAGVAATMWMASASEANEASRTLSDKKSFATAAAVSWTGFYVGSHVGGGWGFNQVTRTDASSAPNFPLGFVGSPSRPGGFLGGGYVGFNYQFDRLVLGIDGDFSVANLTGSSSDVGSLGNTAYRDDKFRWIASVSGRIGYAVNDWMIFGKGGWAWAGFKRDSRSFDTAGIPLGISNYSETRNGWTLGVGIEWEFRPRWLAKLEYGHIEFNSVDSIIDVTNVPTGVISQSSISTDSSLNFVKLGVARLF